MYQYLSLHFVWWSQKTFRTKDTNRNLRLNVHLFDFFVLLFISTFVFAFAFLISGRPVLRLSAPRWHFDNGAFPKNPQKNQTEAGDWKSTTENQIVRERIKYKYFLISKINFSVWWWKMRGTGGESSCVEVSKQMPVKQFPSENHPFSSYWFFAENWFSKTYKFQAFLQI